MDMDLVEIFLAHVMGWVGILVHFVSNIMVAVDCVLDS